MSPLEQAVRAACTHMGIAPDEWTAFRGIGEAAIAAFVQALPVDLASAVGDHLQATGDSAP